MTYPPPPPFSSGAYDRGSSGMLYSNQQERKLGAQLQAALERERDKTNGILARERAASLRRIMALKEELKKAERQMDVELHRSAKVGCECLTLKNE